MIRLLLIVTSLTIVHVCLSVTDDCTSNKKEEHLPYLHHISEFRKRSKVSGKILCKKWSKSEPVIQDSVLGLHGLLHARSQRKFQENTTTAGNNQSLKNDTFQKSKSDSGSKRSRSTLHDIKLRKETISMLHKIVEKYFPGGNLTVEQKIKALKFLGKLMKMKKGEKNYDFKILLKSLSASDSDISSNSMGKPGKNDESAKNYKTSSSNDGDIYANIASGPDIPKLPPLINEKDPDHAHSKIMPVGLQPLSEGTPDEMLNPMTGTNGISYNYNGKISVNQSPFGRYENNMGLDGTYRNINGLYGNEMDRSVMSDMIDNEGYTRDRLPYPKSNAARLPHLHSYDGDDDDDDDDDDDGDDDDENYNDNTDDPEDEDRNDEDDDDDDDDEHDRERSYVYRHHFYDDYDESDDNDMDDIRFAKQFDKRNKIFKSSRQRKSNEKLKTQATKTSK